jgi:hypothetical protein
MADVSRRRDPARDRAQLLLVGALALAVLFIALALLLNTAIYTGNLATREVGGDATPAIEYVTASRAAGVDAVHSVNRRNNTSAADLASAFNGTVARWDDLATHHRAVAGDAADADVVSITEGTRIQQDDAGRAFTSNTTAPNWTVVEGAGVTGVRSMRFTVDESTLPAISGADDATDGTVFHVNVTSNSGTRSVYVYDNTSASAEVLVVDGATETVCPVGSVTGGTFAVDVANASVGGAPCPALGTVDDTDGEVTVEYGDGGAAGGTYTMVVTGRPTAGDVTLAGLTPDGGGSPYWTHAIYGADIAVTYRTDRLEYGARVAVIPE